VVRRARILAPVVLAAVLLPALTGCFANPFVPSAEQLAEEAIEGVTGGAADYTDGELPEGFPTSIPLAEGELGQGVFLGGADGGGWTITLTASDAAAAVASAGADFEAAGFEIVSETPGAEFRALYSSTEYMVTVSQAGDEITYVVVGAGSSAEPAE
jgi:hypothetical protein